jgi:UDP-N-acetylglucosamine 2-epimerase (non-hydrolysing)
MIALILGTRPEIIKMSPIIRECERKHSDYFILHTGQHYSYAMDQIFFDELELPRAKYYLDVGSGTHAVQTGKIMAGIEEVLAKERPDVVLVQGDTNTVLAGALAAAKLRIPVGHVEAGLRSDDRTMPEEVNRVVADHVSDYLFAPTELARKNLAKEGIPEDRITVTGNTIVDALQQNLRIAESRPDELMPLGLSPKKYILATAHRQENVDDPAHLAGIIEGLEHIRQHFELPVVYPVHPRAEKMIAEFGIDTGDITMIKPVGFLAFLQLESQARLVLTDSGGVQEEACILGVPCVTLRENTERPETIEVGANVLVGTNPHEICEGATMMMETEPDWQQPFGDGYAGRMIVLISESVRYNRAARTMTASEKSR